MTTATVTIIRVAAFAVYSVYSGQVLIGTIKRTGRTWRAVTLTQRVATKGLRTKRAAAEWLLARAKEVSK